MNKNFDLEIFLLEQKLARAQANTDAVIVEIKSNGSR